MNSFAPVIPYQALFLIDNRSWTIRIIHAVPFICWIVGPKEQSHQKNSTRCLVQLRPHNLLIEFISIEVAIWV
jgi:hypothetical protein